MPALPTAAAEIVIDGARLDDKYMKQLLDVQVRDNLLLPDTAVVRLRDPEGELLETQPMKPGAAIEVKFGARGDNGVTPVFAGDIVALEPEFTEGDCVIAARAYDRSYKLNLARKSRTFQNATASDMVNTVISENGLAVGTVESTPAVHEFFQQSMETDWQFCWRLADMHNYEFVVDDKKCHFRPRKTAGAVATLEWGTTLLTFKPRMSGVGQAKSVKVANHDPKVRSELAGEAASARLVGTAQAITDRAAIVNKLGGGAVVVADRVAGTQGEATALAQSRLDRMAAAFVEADGKATGNPKVRAGTTVEVKNVGPFSGEYVLAQTTHTFRGGDQYTSSFAISSRGHTLTQILGSGNGNGSPDWGGSLVIGIVTNNNDPEGMGRVRVKFAALGDNMEGWWARVATLNAGQQRGIFMIPEVGDEVVVGFEHGDPRRPFVLGSLYNGKAKPPADMLHEESTKKARFGLISDDKATIDSKQAMTLRSHEKMTVEVKNDGQGGTGDFLLDAVGNIEQKSAKNFTAKAQQSVTVEANQSVTIKGTGSVTVESTGSLKLKGATVDIEGTGPVNVKGAIINLG
jgi:phage protein D/phage baseplate assembly protein gpV